MGVDARMLLKVKEPHMSEIDIKRLSFDLCEAFGPSRFSIRKESSEYWPAQHALEGIKEYKQDGDTIYPEKGEQIVEVHLGGRYWGPDYERGPITDYIAIAEWLELRIPQSTVYYGGDSSGTCAEPFDKEKRAEFFKHFAKVGNKPYWDSFSSIDRTGTATFCDFCEHPMRQYGFGPDYAAYRCAGCGDTIKTRDGGKTWVKPDRKF